MFSQRAVRASQRIGAISRQWTQTSSRRGYAEQAGAQVNAKSSGGAARLAIYGMVFAGLGAAGSWQVLRQSGMGFYSDEESLRRFTPAENDEEARRIQDAINNHPLVAELRSREDLTESRPHMKMPAQYREKSLTAGALQGPQKVLVPPVAWSHDQGKEFVSIIYVGDNLCGHPGIIHGGFLATMLDEGLARCCFPVLPHKIGVTANLNINYRKPTPANSFLVLRAETVKTEGRKAWVKGHIELLSKPGEKPTVFAEATGLFVSPKYAAMMPRIS